MRRRPGRRRRFHSGQSPLRLTSLMDILATLLLFLLKTYVAGGEVITPAPGVHLPASTSVTNPASSVVVAVFGGTIMIDGKVVATLPEAGGRGDLLIPDLADQLALNLQQGQAIADRRGDTESYTPKVAIQGDREIPFAVLQRVMYTCNHSGYGDIALAVLGAS